MCVSPRQQTKRYPVRGRDIQPHPTHLATQERPGQGFHKRYGVHTLVWYEAHSTMESAIAREKAIKEWKRAWKIELIEKSNPEWRDLYEELW